MKQEKVKVNLWIVFLTQVLNFWNGVVRIVKSGWFHALVLVLTFFIFAAVGFVFKYGEIKTEITWNHYLQVSREEAKKQYVMNQVKYVMSLYKCDSLEIYETIMTTFDPVYIAVMIGIESEYNRNAISSAPAYGLTQCTGDKFKKTDNWRDVRTNINTGANYLKSMLKQFNGNKELALAAYNAGPQSVINAGYKVPTNTKTGETVPYVARGMKMLNNLETMR